MGNDNSLPYYDNVETKESNKIINKVPLEKFHSKGKPYGAMLKLKLNGINPTKTTFYEVSDLRNGKPSYGFGICVCGNELNFGLALLDLSDEKKPNITATIKLRYSNSKSNFYTTFLKSTGDMIIYDKKKYIPSTVEMEIYADNIHCRLIETLGMKKNFTFSGYIKFDQQDKFPFAI